MSRRVSLPAAEDLFHTTRHGRDTRERQYGAASARPVPAPPEPAVPTRDSRVQEAQSSAETVVSDAVHAAAPSGRKPSGRVRHDEKMTIYVTADELLDIEHARLSLRRDQGLAVDRGRLVREAIAIALEDLEDNGDYSVLVQRLIRR